MIPTLPVETRRELAELAGCYGQPLVREVDLTPNSLLTTQNIGVGAGEVCMVVRRINGQLLTFRKKRLLAVVAYGSGSAHLPPIFYTVAFLLDEVGGTLGALDEHEQVEAFRNVERAELLTIADQLDHLDVRIRRRTERSLG